jgi:ribosomal protein L14
MKATLQFNLDNPDDEMAHMRCVKAKDMALAIWDIQQLLREWMKRKDGSYIRFDEAQSAICLIIESYDINLDELIN